MRVRWCLAVGLVGLQIGTALSANAACPSSPPIGLVCKPLQPPLELQSIDPPSSPLVEVLHVTWPYCSYCSKSTPAIRTWARGQQDVVLREMIVSWAMPKSLTVGDPRVFDVVLDLVGASPAVRAEFIDETSSPKQPWNAESAYAFAARHGWDRGQIDALVASPPLADRLQQRVDVAKTVAPDGVPFVVVARRHALWPTHDGNPVPLFQFIAQVDNLAALAVGRRASQTAGAASSPASARPRDAARSEPAKSTLPGPGASAAPSSSSDPADQKWLFLHSVRTDDALFYVDLGGLRRSRARSPAGEISLFVRTFMRPGKANTRGHASNANQYAFDCSKRTARRLAAYFDYDREGNLAAAGEDAGLAERVPAPGTVLEEFVNLVCDPAFPNPQSPGYVEVSRETIAEDAQRRWAQQPD